MAPPSLKTYLSFMSSTCAQELSEHGGNPLTPRCKMETEFFSKPDVQAGIDTAYEQINQKCATGECYDLWLSRLNNIVRRVRVRETAQRMNEGMDRDISLHQATVETRTSSNRSYRSALFSPSCVSEGSSDTRCQKEQALIGPIYDAALSNCLAQSDDPATAVTDCLVDAMSLTFHLAYPKEILRGSIAQRVQKIWHSLDKTANWLRKMQISTAVLSLGGR